MIELPHWDDSGDVRDGALVVHADHVDAIIRVFGRLFDARFPIHSMQPITAFAGEDDASMAANNTSAFNCREIAGRPGVWSQHAYGGAIDINPLVNPWVRGSQVDPPAGAPYVDRTVDVAGLIRRGDVVTSAFADVGWGWGGDWSGALDYQHFSWNGR
ncbi:MAG: M15 family metallopeptidase [Acidimicrobiales bacterium]